MQTDAIVCVYHETDGVGVGRSMNSSSCRNSYLGCFVAVPLLFHVL